MTLSKRKVNLLVLIVALGLLRFGLILFHPSHNASIPPDVLHTDHISVIPMLANPVIQFLLCMAFSFMLITLDFMMRKQSSDDKKSTVIKQHNLNSKWRKIASALLFIIGVYVLIQNWTYIHEYFLGFISFIMYNAYNPSSQAQHMGYYDWKNYVITGPGALLALIVGPVLVPFLYHMRKVIRLLKKQQVQKNPS